MAGTQALTASRTPAFSYDPNDLIISDTPGDPLYQKGRNELALTRDDVLAIATVGSPSSLKVRRRDDGDYVVTGRQRTKAAAVANELGAGVRYTGSLASIRSAILEFAKDADLCKRLTVLMRNKPIRLIATSANHGDDGYVRTVMAVENAYSHGEQKMAIMRAVQEDAERFGNSPEMIATARRVPLSTIKRWLKTDLSKPATRKPRGTSTRPSIAKIKKVMAAATGTLSVVKTLAWAIGEIDDAEFKERFPGCAKAFK